MARNQEQNKKMRDLRSARIVAAALKLFAEQGLTATKISDIAAASKSSQGLVYHYFKSKEEIFSELIRDAFAKLNAACLGLEAMDLPPRQKIELALTELINGFSQHADAARMHMLIAQATMTRSVPREAKAIIKKQNMLPYRVLERIMAEGQKEGSITKTHPARELALLFWTTIKGLAMHKAAHGDKYQPPDPGIIMRMFLK
jgi:TetR/AcrR family transcriptional regulator